MSDLLEEPLAVLRDFVLALEELHIPYIVGGSFASGIHGEFRATHDIDVVCDFDKVDFNQFVLLLEPKFFVDSPALQKAVREQRSFNIIHINSAFKVDVFTSIGEFEREQLDRGLVVTAYGTSLSVKVATVEDMILAKLRWYKKGNCVSERQWNDLIGMLRIKRTELDNVYLKTWSGKLDLDFLLEKLMREKV